MPEKASKKDAICIIYRATGLALEHDATHFSNVNSSKSVWWFDLPLEKLKSRALSALDLLVVSKDLKKLHHLRVPVNFLSDNLEMFHIREKKQCISLELSALGGNQFQDVRPTSKRLQFKEFLVGTVELEKYIGFDLKQESFLGQKFEGGITVDQLKICSDAAPDSMGVYLIVRPATAEPINILDEGSGGWHKGRDPNADTRSSVLANWIPDVNILYVGKAGGTGLKATLRSRLRDYMRFGSGKGAPHSGGRYIWRLEDSDDLLVYWRVTPFEEPASVESFLLREFMATHGRLPFANLKN